MVMATNLYCKIPVHFVSVDIWFISMLISQVFDQHGHYCQVLPSTGDTFIILDLPYTPARSVSSQLNIYKVSGAGEQVALASNPFALRQNGIIELRFKIDSPGNFIANIIFQGVENSSHDYPFSASLSSDHCF